MLDDFFTRALFAGIGLSVIVGPLGCLIIWRQMAFFGDILAVSKIDLMIIYGGGALIMGTIFWQWRRLLAAIVSPEIAEAEGLSPQRAEWLFMILIAFVVSISLKLVGVLLITALMIIPAAAARRFGGKRL